MDWLDKCRCSMRGPTGKISFAYFWDGFQCHSKLWSTGQIGWIIVYVKYIPIAIDKYSLDIYNLGKSVIILTLREFLKDLISCFALIY